MGSRRPKPAPSAPQWQVILEEIRSENRSTLEAVEAFRESVEERIERLDRDSRGRDELLSLALTDLRHELADLKDEVRHHGSDLTELKRLSLRFGSDVGELKALGQQHTLDTSELKLTVQANSVELRSLSQKVDALNRLEERVAALERRAAEPEGGASPPLA